MHCHGLPRFLYTGQRYFGGIDLYYYKNRFYHPTAGGRFLQPDPIGYGSGMNLYAYVGGDPVNFTDPMGLAQVFCTGTRICRQHDSGGSGGSGSGGGKDTSNGKDRGSSSGNPNRPVAQLFGSSTSGTGLPNFHYVPGARGSVTASGDSVIVTAGREGFFYYADGPAGGTTLVPSPPTPWDPHLDSALYAPTAVEIAAVRTTFGVVRDQIKTGYYSNKKVHMRPFENRGPSAFLPPPRGAYYEATVFFPGVMGRGTARIVVDTGNLGVFFYTPKHYRWFMPFVVGN